ncbi:MAG TPA: extracellular solute-binding protein [Limnochordia bacterium]
MKRLDIRNRKDGFRESLRRRRSGSLILCLVWTTGILTWTDWVAAAERITLQHLGYVWHGEPWQEYMEARIAEFERLHPNLHIERVVTDDMVEKFTVMAAGGIAPDVAEMTLSQGGNLAPTGAFSDLRPFFAKDASIKISDFAKPAIAALSWSDGSLWGFPLDVYPVASYYNIDLFAQAGLATPRELGASGWTWAYATAAAKKLTVDTTGDGTADRWGLDSAWALVSYGIPIRQAGGGLYDRYVDPTRSRLTDARTVQAFEWIADLYRAGVTAADYEVQFEQGLTGFNLTNGPTWIGTLNQVGGFRWDVGPPLMGPSHNGGYVAVNSIQISAYTEHPELAWEWVKFLAADAEHIRDFVHRTTRIPAYLPVLSAYPRLIDQAPPGMQHFIDVILNPNSYHPPVGPTTRTAGDLIFNAFFDRIIEQNAAVRGTMEALDPQVNAILTEGRAQGAGRE